MKRRCLGFFLAIGLLCGTPAVGMAAAGEPFVTPQVQELQERMLKDEGIMALIMALQNDPEMQALLQDPSVIAAVNAGDVSALTNSPAFLKLLDKPQVKDIRKRLEGQGAAPR